MSEPFVGEIRMFAGNFAPRGWAFCDGQLLAINQNDALFSLFGTIYGGDGRTTFGLPDLRGRVPVHAGSGPGLSTVNIGHKGGVENETLTVAQLPSHSHTAQGQSASAGSTRPAGSGVARPDRNLYRDSGTAVAMNAAAVTSVGGSRSHTNLQPFLCVHFIVALFGIYPSRH